MLPQKQFADLTAEMYVFEHLEGIPFADLARMWALSSCLAAAAAAAAAACVLSLIRFKLMVAIYPDLTDGGVLFFFLSLAPIVFGCFGFGDIFLTLEERQTDG